jgi:iron-sulfur cluster assembly protein
MALDEPKENDEVFNEKGITFLMNRDLFELAKPISVDYITSRMGNGFKVASSLEAGSACGSSCSC